MKRFLFCLAIIFPLFAYLAMDILHAEEKRLGQKFIDAYYAKDENAMRTLIKENKETVPDEVGGMLGFATEKKIGWMVEVCEKMATLYKDETGDISLLNEIKKAKGEASGGGEGDGKLVKLQEEITAIGSGRWHIMSMDYNDHMLQMEIGVDPDVGMNIAKKDVATAGKTIEKILPEAHGRITWLSFGVGVASLLKDTDSGSWKSSEK